MDWDELVDEVVEYFTLKYDEFINTVEILDGDTDFIPDSLKYYDMDELDYYLTELTGNPNYSSSDKYFWLADDFDETSKYFYHTDWDGLLHSAGEKNYDEYLDDVFVDEIYQQYSGNYGIFGTGEHLPAYVRKLFDEFIASGGAR